MTDPQVVLQAHALRTRASTDALLHGSRRARVRRATLATLAGSGLLAGLILGAVVVTTRVVSVLHQSGH